VGRESISVRGVSQPRGDLRTTIDLASALQDAVETSRVKKIIEKTGLGLSLATRAIFMRGRRRTPFASGVQGATGVQDSRRDLGDAHRDARLTYPSGHAVNRPSVPLAPSCPTTKTDSRATSPSTIP
jgi:hypothetical protein